MNDTDTTAITFLGRITESVTLDLRNVLATVKENAEFLEDLVATDDGTVSPEKNQFSHALSVIKDQVARGVDLAASLNAFSRSPDKPASEMDLKELLQMSVRICEQTARLKGITLRAVPGDDPLIVLGNPLEIEMALFECIDFLMNSQGTRDTIEIRGGRRDAEEIEVAFLSRPASMESPAGSAFRADPARWSLLKERVKRVNGSLVPGRPPVRLALVFRNELV